MAIDKCYNMNENLPLHDPGGHRQEPPIANFQEMNPDHSILLGALWRNTRLGFSLFFVQYRI
jgi:hypothetical protein